MKKALIIILLVLLVTAIPAYASASVSVNEIKPISPDELAQNVNNLLTDVYDQGKPYVTILSKVVLAITGVMMILALFIGRNIFAKAVGAAAFVFLGLTIYFKVDKILGIYLWFCDHFRQGGI